MRVWLFKEGEPLPTDDHPQLLRTGILANALKDAGHQVEWFSSSFDHGKKQFRSNAKVKNKISADLNLYLLKGCGYRTNISFRRVLHQHQSARHFKQLSSQLEKPDVVIASYPTPELAHAASVYAWENNIPFIVDVRDPWPDAMTIMLPPLVKTAAAPLIWHYGRLFRKCLSNADGLVSISSTMLNWALKKQAHQSHCQTRVFYLGADKTVNNSTTLVKPSGFSEHNSLRCVFYGMFGKCRDGETVINAARLLKQRGIKAVEFVFAGDGELRKSWENQAADLENVKFTGWLNSEQADALFYRSHIGIVAISGALNKFWFGNKFFQYLSHGLALVNDTGGEVYQSIACHKNGRNYSPGDATSLADTIEMFLNSPQALNEACRSSLRLAEGSFSRQDNYRRYVDFVESFTKQSTQKIANA